DAQQLTEPIQHGQRLACARVAGVRTGDGLCQRFTNRGIEQVLRLPEVHLEGQVACERSDLNELLESGRVEGAAAMRRRQVLERSLNREREAALVERYPQVVRLAEQRPRPFQVDLLRLEDATQFAIDDELRSHRERARQRQPHVEQE